MSKDNWQKYAEFWTMEEGLRKIRLSEVATPDVTYCDPNTSLSGAEAFSDFISQFQKDVPGGHFVITDVFEHHNQTLAHWDMCGADGSLMVKGTSFANLNDDGKFTSFTGFFAGN